VLSDTRALSEPASEQSLNDVFWTLKFVTLFRVSAERMQSTGERNFRRDVHHGHTRDRVTRTRAGAMQ